jgi:hypothetical protein
VPLCTDVLRPIGGGRLCDSPFTPFGCTARLQMSPQTSHPLRSISGSSWIVRVALPLTSDEYWSRGARYRAVVLWVPSITDAFSRRDGGTDGGASTALYDLRQSSIRSECLTIFSLVDDLFRAGSAADIHSLIILSGDKPFGQGIITWSQRVGSSPPLSSSEHARH